ncbi:MAG: hypothetical protein N3F07_00730 [Candidatus Micrarchaeota archaeon]|nr:hypothetical protein [Candidatus Micrarchaeota archaeon]
MVFCLTCGAEVDEYDSAYYARAMLCIPCYIKKTSEASFAICSKCGLRVRQEESKQRRGRAYCGYCFSELERIDQLPECSLCARRIEAHQHSLRLSDGSIAHSSCAAKKWGRQIQVFCFYCGKETSHFKILPNGKATCPRCDKSASQEGGSKARHMPILVAVLRRIAGAERQQL